jgi:NADPH2:quinone reductase
MKAMRIASFGGPEVLRLEDVPISSPRSGQVLVKVEAAGLNYIDVYHRTGLYPNPLPFTPGLEGVGTVAALGPDVTGLRQGDRVAWASALGSYAEQVIAPAAQLVTVPAGIDPHSAAAVMLQGMTAHYLTESTYPLKAGDTCLVHAAAGGVGLLLVQMAKQRGARVFGTVSTDEKAALAREAGADEVILYTKQDFPAEVKRLTGGRGLQVVYDSVGQSTFEKSLDCLTLRGMLVLYGQSSGPVPAFSPGVLASKGSLFLTRPTLNTYAASREDLVKGAAELFSMVKSRKVKISVNQTYPLRDAAQAQRDLESRKTTGSTVLLP